MRARGSEDKGSDGGRACKPDSVPAAPCRSRLRRETFSTSRSAVSGDHSSRSRLTPRLEQPTRGLTLFNAPKRSEQVPSSRVSGSQGSGPGQPSPPIWPCTTRGLPCLPCCHGSGGLLTRLFTLAQRNRLMEDVPSVSRGPVIEPYSARRLRSRRALRRRSILCGTIRDLTTSRRTEARRGMPKHAFRRKRNFVAGPLALPGALPSLAAIPPQTAVSGLSSRRRPLGLAAGDRPARPPIASIHLD